MMHRRLPIFVLALVLCLLVSSSVCGAQKAQRESDVSYWLSLGPGIGSAGDFGALGLSGSISGNIGRHLLSVRSAADVYVFGGEVWDFGVLYGLASRSKRRLYSIAIGAAAVGGEQEGAPIRGTIGVPVEAQVFGRFWRVMGFGLYGFANVNAEQSFYGVTVCLQVGRYR